MKVKILEENGIRHAGIHYQSGDEITVDDDIGAMFCANGWASDTSGEVETGERRTDLNVTLSVENGSLDQRAEDAG